MLMVEYPKNMQIICVKKEIKIFEIYIQNFHSHFFVHEINHILMESICIFFHELLKWSNNNI